MEQLYVVFGLKAYQHAIKHLGDVTCNEVDNISSSLNGDLVHENGLSGYWGDEGCPDLDSCAHADVAHSLQA